MHFLFFILSRIFIRRPRAFFLVGLWVGAWLAVEARGERLIVGVPVDNFPVSFLNPAGEPTGFAVAMLEEVAKREGLELSYVTGSKAEITSRFLGGEFDVMASFTPGIGYQGTGLYSIPYLKPESVLIARKEAGYAQMKQLRGKKFAVATYSLIGPRFLSDVGLSPSEVLTCGTTGEAITAVVEGRADVAFVSSSLVSVYMLEQAVSGLVPVGSQIVGYDLRYCYGIKAGRNELQETINRGLIEFRQSGEYEGLYHRWIGYASAALLSREQMLVVLLLTLALFAILALAFLWHQRMLLRRIKAQAGELRESQAILEKAQKLARVGYFRYEHGKRELVCSDETLSIIERKRSDGSPSYHKLMSLVAESDRPHVHRAVRKAMQSVTASEVIYILEPLPGMRKTVHLSLQPLFDHNGKANGLLGTLQNISVQRATESELRAHEQLLRALYNHVPAALGVIELVPDGLRLVSANRGSAEIFGLPGSTELNDRLLRDLGMSEPLLEFWSHWFRRGYDQMESTRTDQFLEATRRHYAISMVPLEGGAGAAQRLCYFVEDMTARKQVDAEVAQGRRQRAVGELVCGIAHEFNNLLTPILLKTEGLAHEFGGNPQAMDELRIITRAAKRGAELTRRLLSVGRSSDAKAEPIILHKFAQGIFDLMRSSIDRRIGLGMQVPDHLPLLYLVPSDVQQVVVNLILNARDSLLEKLARAPGDNWHPKIQIEAQSYVLESMECNEVPSLGRPLGWICLGVRDNGVGIPTERLPALFSPALSSNRGADAKVPGLGLATASLLINRLGGKITVQSNAGEGALFNLWLPVLQVPAGEITAETVRVDVKTVPMARRDFARILFVEDDDMVAQTIITALRRQKHAVTHFTNGADAWRYLSVHPHDFDLLLVDMDLPGMNGLELARRARGSRFQGKVIVTSGRLPEIGAVALQELKVDAQIEKPFSPQSLNLVIMGVLNA